MIENRKEKAKELLKRLGYRNIIIICNSKDWNDYARYYANGRCTTPIKNTEYYDIVKEFYYVDNNIVYEKEGK